MKVGYLAAMAADKEQQKKKGLLSITKALFSRPKERQLRTGQLQVNQQARKNNANLSTAWAAEFNNP